MRYIVDAASNLNMDIDHVFVYKLELLYMKYKSCILHINYALNMDMQYKYEWDIGQKELSPFVPIVNCNLNVLYSRNLNDNCWCLRVERNGEKRKHMFLRLELVKYCIEIKVDGMEDIDMNDLSKQSE